MEGSSRRARFIRRLSSFLSAGLIATLAACHPGNKEAIRLRGECEAGNASACATLGDKLLKGEYVLRDRERGAELVRVGCDGGVPDACTRLGVLYQNGTGVKRDSVQAIALLQKGCETQSMEGCGLLGRQYHLGRGVPQDVMRAVTLYE